MSQFFSQLCTAVGYCFSHFFAEYRQLAYSLFFCICLIYLLEIFHEFLDVFIAHKTGAAADLVNDASLYPILP